jgi:hypothetical protein
MKPAPQKVIHMLGIILFFARALGYVLGAVGLFLSLVFFFADRKEKRKRLQESSQSQAWVSENPPLEVSRHG